MGHDRYDYSPIGERPPLHFPDGARLALWVVPNIEHFRFDRPSTSIAPHTAAFVPDVLNYGWRDYGVRVGVWRMMDVLEQHAVPATVALNAGVCDHYPQIVAATTALGWEHMGHGQTNSVWLTGQTEEEERQIIRCTLDTIATATGVRPTGWLSPSLTETLSTPDLLAEEGVRYLADWANDEQPYPMRVRRHSLLSLPYSIEINDISVFIGSHGTAEEFQRRIVDQFDVLYEDPKNTGRVMCIALHPFLIGHPFRSKYLDQALRHLRARREVWWATGAEICRWYEGQAGAAERR